MTITLQIQATDEAAFFSRADIGISQTPDASDNPMQNGTGKLVTKIEMLSPTIFRGILADYPQEDAQPYCISISNQQTTQFYCFGINEPIPTLPIPLVDKAACSIRNLQTRRASYK